MRALPAHALARALRARLAPLWQRCTLALITPLPCDTRALAPAAAVDLGGILRHSPRSDACWQAAGLTGLLPEEVPGGVNAGDRRALYYLVHGRAARSVLEIGTHVGASTLYLAAALRDAAGGQAHLVTVDVRDVNDAATGPWRAAGLAGPPGELLLAIACEAQVTFECGTALNYLAAPGPSFDLIFLDGDHLASAVYREVPAALRRLNAGGVIVLHDYFPALRPLWPAGELIPGPWLAIERLHREGAALRALPLGELPWPTKLGSRYTSLAVLAAG